MRLLLFPFSIIYGIIIFLRNFIFEYGVIIEKDCGIPTVSIGNLSTGGTGKTPFTETMINAFGMTYDIAVLSRGYGRKTAGFRWVEVDSKASEVGDEMLQVKRKFPKIPVAVCESRLDGAKVIKKECQDVNLLLLDDAYQHRYITRHINILLTTYKRPYFKDFLLPVGNLREFRYSKTRADVIVVTKCPPGSTRVSMRKYFRKIRASGKQYATFAVNSYDDAKGLFDGKQNDLNAYQKCLMVTGIANNQDLLEHLQSLDKEVHALAYKDHANYDKGRIRKIIGEFEKLNEGSDTCIITTDKDATKLSEWQAELEPLPIFSLSYQLKLDNEHKLRRFMLPAIIQ